MRAFDPTANKTLGATSKSTKSDALIRIAVVDDHPLYRDGVIQTLKMSGRFEIIAEGETAQDAISIARAHAPDVLLLDVGIPGGGIESARTIVQDSPAVKILFLTASEADADVFASLDAGGRGYVLKGIGGSELANMVTAVHFGETAVTPSLAGRLLSSFNAKPQAVGPARTQSDLTAREDGILDAVACGLSNKEIANKLNLTEKTVKHYMTNIMQKLHVRNRVEAAMARRSAKQAKQAKPTPDPRRSVR